jgi:Dynamitin
MDDVAEKHDADQAGGSKEVIFSSDGADPIAPVAFPVLETKDEGLVEDSLMTAEQAFEVFAGKLYAPNPYEKKSDVVDAEHSKEPPLVRLARLNREIEELGKDYQGTEESIALQDQLARLQVQLQEISLAQVQKHKGLSSAISQAGQQIDSKTPSSPPLATTTERIPSQFEERLQKLERSYFGVSGSKQSLLDRLGKLEAMQIDEATLERLHKRGKVIRQDLEAAAKARSKLMASVGSSAEDSKTITALYDQLQQSQGVAHHLPALAERLQTLAHHHSDASTRAGRFRAMEQLAQNLHQHVQSMEGALSTLEGTMQQNTTTMQVSIKALEERMQAL